MVVTTNELQLTRVFLKIKAAREELSAKFNERDKALEEQQKIIKQELLELCKEKGIDYFTTEAGRVKRSKKTIYWTSDWNEMYEFVMEHKVPEFFNKALNQTNVKNFLDEHPDLLPKGLNIDSEYVISVYKPTKKRGT